MHCMVPYPVQQSKEDGRVGESKQAHLCKYIFLRFPGWFRVDCAAVLLLSSKSSFEKRKKDYVQYPWWVLSLTETVFDGTCWDAMPCWHLACKSICETRTNNKRNQPFISMDRTKVGRKASSACIGLFGPLAAGKGNDYVIRKESSPMPSKNSFTPPIVEL